MSDVKQPQDRKSKKGTATVQGVEVAIPHDRLRDWDVVENVAAMQDPESSPPEKLIASVKVLRILLGADYERVKKELREANDGALTADTMGAFLTEVFEQLNPNS